MSPAATGSDSPLVTAVPLSLPGSACALLYVLMICETFPCVTLHNFVVPVTNAGADLAATSWPFVPLWVVIHKRLHAALNESLTNLNENRMQSFPFICGGSLLSSSRSELYGYLLTCM